MPVEGAVVAGLRGVNGGERLLGVIPVCLWQSRAGTAATRPRERCGC